MTTFWYNILPIIIGLVVGLVAWYIHYQRTQELSEELEELQSQNARLTQAHDTLNSQCEHLNNSYAVLSETHKKLDFHHANLQVEFADFKAEKMAFSAIEVDNSALNKQIDDLENQLASVNLAFTNYKNAAESRVQNAEGQLQILRGQYEKMLDSYIQQGQHIKSLGETTATNHTESFRAEKRADEAQISALEIELSTAQAAHLQYKNEEAGRYQQLSGQYETMLNKYVQQGQQLKNMATEIAEWQSHFESLMLKKNNQETQILELEEARAGIGKEIAILRGEFNMQKSRNKTLNNELLELNTKYAELEAEKAKINNDLTSMSSSFSAKSSNWELRYNELESRHSSLTRRFHDSSASNERMEKTITGLNVEILQYRRRTNPDDLKQIEGIGPKIEELLNEEGIYKYEQLAATKVDTLRAILDKAGTRFKMHDPQSWSSQAELADKGEWTKLKEYQDYLVGGRVQEQPFVAVASR
jgi:predicted flap endonuclease-1-like 5' DNA nuclease/predicted  nucleic acid-binding Zn-ribbon protein